MANLIGMIDAVTDAGADNTGATDATTALSNAVAMCFGFSTMAQHDAAQPPKTHVRDPSRWLYIPPGIYKLQSSLVLQAMEGLRVQGGGWYRTILSCEGGTPTNPLTAALDLNGIAFCTFSDFTVAVATGCDVRVLIYVHWDLNRAGRSTTRNVFTNMAANVAEAGGFFREAAWQFGALIGDGPQGVQCDQTELFNVFAWGSYDEMRGNRDLVGGVMKKDLYFQRGYRFGDATVYYGNNGWHHAHGLYADHCRYGVDWCAAECPIFGGLIQSNDVDLFASAPPASYITVKNIRSEDSGRFFSTSGGGGNTNNFHASLEDCHWTIPMAYGEGDELRSDLTSATPNTLTDTSQQWSPNEWVGHIARIITGAGAVQERPIVQNTGNSLVVAANWMTTPDPGSVYAITRAATGGTAVAAGNAGTLQRSPANWKVNWWRGYYVYLLSGPGKGQVGWVDSNTNNTLAIDNTHAPLDVDPALLNWTNPPDTETAFQLAKVPPDGEFIQWNFAGVFRISGLQAYGPMYSVLGIRHVIGLHASVRQCTALIDGVSIGETTRAQAFPSLTTSPLAAIEVRGWESVAGLGGQIEQGSEAGEILINAGQAVDIKTITASTILDKGYDHVRVDASAGAVTVTLPDARRFVGRRFTVKKIDASTNAVMIKAQSGQTIDNLASKSTKKGWAVFRLYSTGDNWETD